MSQEDTKEAPKADRDSNTEDLKASEQAEEREKETHLLGALSSDQASQELPVEDADRVAEGDPVSQEDKDSEQTQDEPDDPLRPPMPPSLVYKGRPLGPTAGGAGHKPRPKPGPR